MDGPDQIGPDHSPKRSVADHCRRAVRTLTTKLVYLHLEQKRNKQANERSRDGLIGDYDYAFLFRPNLPFMKKARRASPFFGLHDKIPVVLALLLGLQHALAMLAGGMFRSFVAI